MSLKLKFEVKKLWIGALIDDDSYKQGKGALTTVSSRGVRKDCCLGVLCDLAYKAGVVERNKASDSEGGIIYVYGEERIDAVLPKEVINWAFELPKDFKEVPLAAQNPFVNSKGKYRSLASINDHGYDDGTVGDFAHIAELIRENL